MAKSKPQRQRGKQGIPGPPGPTGKTGSTGIMGHMGHTGERGPKGAVGQRGPTGSAAILPSERRSLFATLHEQVDSIYTELDVQMKRMAQLQVQLDEVRQKMRSLAGDSK
jgi:hypothetical protein